MVYRLDGQGERLLRTAGSVLGSRRVGGFRTRAIAYLLIVGALLSTGFIIGFRSLPERVQVIYPSEHSGVSDLVIHYVDGLFGGKSSVTWLDSKRHLAECTIIHSKVPASCGLAIKFPLKKYSMAAADQSAEYFHSFNLSDFDTVRIKLLYQGDSERIQIYFRNNEDRFPSIDSEKFMTSFIETDKLSQVLELELSRFIVPKWWLRKNYQLTSESDTDFSNIVMIGYDLVRPVPEGRHLLRIDHIEAVGPAYSLRQLSSALIFVWMTILGLMIVNTIKPVRLLSRRQRVQP